MTFLREVSIGRTPVVCDACLSIIFVVLPSLWSVIVSQYFQFLLPTQLKEYEYLKNALLRNSLLLNAELNGLPLSSDPTSSEQPIVISYYTVFEAIYSHC